MPVRQTRIFVPAGPPFNEGDWVSTVVGHVVRPVASFAGLGWFHFNRYLQPRTDSGDCSIEEIPCEFGADLKNGQWESSGELGVFRSIRFRYRIEDAEQALFESRIRELVDARGCAISDFREFKHVEDYGGSRFVDVTRAALRPERAELMGQFLCAATRLFLHGLVGPDGDGRFRQETNGTRTRIHSGRDSSPSTTCSATWWTHGLLCGLRRSLRGWEVLWVGQWC